jgi:hypothetical protein
MEGNNINVYLIQETWLDGDQDHWEIHGPKKQTSSRGCGGLAIALSRKVLKVWERAGRKEMHRHGVMDDTTCIIVIDLKVLARNSFECITIYNVYAPSRHSNTAKVVKEFWTELENEIEGTPEGSTPIVGSGA